MFTSTHKDMRLYEASRLV